MDKNDKNGVKHRYFCLTEQQIIGYHKNDMLPSEKVWADKHIASCELCADAVEGLRAAKDPAAFQEIREKVRERFSDEGDNSVLHSFGRNSTVRVAAAAASLVAISIAVYLFFFNQVQHNDQLALNDQAQEQVEEVAQQVPPAAETAPVEAAVTATVAPVTEPTATTQSKTPAVEERKPQPIKPAAVSEADVVVQSASIQPVPGRTKKKQEVNEMAGETASSLVDPATTSAASEEVTAIASPYVEEKKTTNEPAEVPADIKALRKQAKQLLKEGNYSKSIAVCNKILAANPGDKDAINISTQARQKLSQAQGATPAEARPEE